MLKKIVPFLKRMANKWRPFFDAPVKTILETHEGVPFRQKNLCLFAHFDPDGVIGEHVLFYIQQLSTRFDVVLISTSNRFEEQSLESAKKLCSRILRRKNVGLDFASWCAAMATLPDFKNKESLLLANDSVFGPVRSLDKVFEFFDLSPLSVCGMTDSFEIEPHLQSYFLYLKKDFLRSSDFDLFFKNIRCIYDKQKIIENYEVGFSRFAREHGWQTISYADSSTVHSKALSMNADFQYAERLKGSVRNLNTTLFMWDILLKEFDFPFIKAEILKVNRFASTTAKSWPSMVSPEMNSLIPMVEKYLKRVC